MITNEFKLFFFTFLAPVNLPSIGENPNNSAQSDQPTSSKVKPTLALSRWKKITGTALFINRLGKRLERLHLQLAQHDKQLQLREAKLAQHDKQLQLREANMLDTLWLNIQFIRSSLFYAKHVYAFPPRFFYPVQNQFMNSLAELYWSSLVNSDGRTVKRNSILNQKLR